MQIGIRYDPETEQWQARVLLPCLTERGQGATLTVSAEADTEVEVHDDIVRGIGLAVLQLGDRLLTREGIEVGGEFELEKDPT